jgi:endonuclease YncB( thermonuclease family)
MSYFVTKIINGETFQVTPGWEWDNATGDRVILKGFRPPERGQPGYEEACEKLRGLILNQQVELKPEKIIHGSLVCEVFIKDVNLATHFPEFK